MLGNINIDYMQEQIDLSIDIAKFVFIMMCTFYTNFKLTNKKIQFNFRILLYNVIISVVSGILRYKISYIECIVCSVVIVSFIFSTDNIRQGMISTLISLSINFIIFTISIIINYFTNLIFGINNNSINLLVILLVHTFLLYCIFKIKKFKNGISFLKNKKQDEFTNLIVLNVSTIILFSIILVVNSEMELATSLTLTLLIFFFIMFITIQKSIQLYYKQKLLVQELKETKDKLEEKTKEIKELEEENIKISKKSHTLVHKQKSLEHKIDGLIGKTEISKEEVGELTNRIKEINKELYKQKTAIELDKTEIPQIDDMLKYMQSECKKNNIDFELQIKGNIHHMINNLISKEDLETLLADHIKNAIIAINHGNNINRSILVRIGKIDECYGLYIYDSGIEFEKETLKNLGKKPCTTHANEGGTGMGFMNTFDTLKKCNASLIIEEYNEPSKDNYTKVLKIKFNNKNEFEIKTYR